MMEKGAKMTAKKFFQQLLLVRSKLVVTIFKIFYETNIASCIKLINTFVAKKQRKMTYHSKLVTLLTLASVVLCNFMIYNAFLRTDN